MPGVLTSVPSRQRTEATRLVLPARGFLGGGEQIESRPVRASGYNAVVGLVLSDVAGTVTILAAPERVVGARRRPGTFIPIATIPTTLQGGVQAAQVDEEVRGDFIRVRYTNGAAKQADFQFSVYLVPVFCFKRVEVSGGGGGALAVTGTLAVTGSPGTTIGPTAADTALAPGATGPLPAPPAGTRRMSVQVTGGDATTRIRVRELGGVAGAGDILSLLASTMYGGADGAVAPLEAQNVAGPAAAVTVRFERS